MIPRPRPLTCACCGGDAGIWQQWHNQDAGFGLCPKCADWITERDARLPADFRTDLTHHYGRPGYHREPATHERTMQ